MSTKEKKIAKLEQTIKTAQLDLLTLESKPLLTQEEMEKMDEEFIKFALGTIGFAVAFGLFFKLVF